MWARWNTKSTQEPEFLVNDAGSDVRNPAFPVTVGDIVAAVAAYNASKGYRRIIIQEQPDMARLAKLNLRLAQQSADAILDGRAAFELVDILLKRTSTEQHLSDQVLNELQTKLGSFWVLVRFLKEHNVTFFPFALLYEQAKDVEHIKQYLEKLKRIDVPIERYGKVICQYWQHDETIFNLVTRIIGGSINPNENLTKVLKYAAYARRIEGYLEEMGRQSVEPVQALTAVLKRFDVLIEMEELLQSNQLDLHNFHAWFFREATQFFILLDVKYILEKMKQLMIPYSEERMRLIYSMTDQGKISFVLAALDMLDAFLRVTPESSRLNSQDYFDYALKYSESAIELIRASQAQWADQVLGKVYQMTAPIQQSVPVERAVVFEAEGSPRGGIPFSIFAPAQSPLPRSGSSPQTLPLQVLSPTMY